MSLKVYKKKTQLINMAGKRKQNTQTKERKRERQKKKAM